MSEPYVLLSTPDDSCNNIQRKDKLGKKHNCSTKEIIFELELPEQARVEKMV